MHRPHLNGCTGLPHFRHTSGSRLNNFGCLGCCRTKYKVEWWSTCWLI